MTELTENAEIMKFILCPDCSGNLGITENQLQCSACKRNYEIKNGIPYLFPSDMDTEHLDEEEELADMMLRTPVERKDIFSRQQWDRSKEEFWAMVKSNIQGENKSIINIGCGFDFRFKDYESAGHTFVNFDLVSRILCFLKDNHGAKSCVGGDIDKLPFRKGSFDYAISIDVIHHEIDNLEETLGYFSNLLKANGTLFLEDLNAWGMFQAPKSILLPQPVHGFLRRIYHKIKRSTHKPADYEFPTNVWRTINILKKLNFTDIEVHPNTAYPGIGPGVYKVYSLFSGSDYIKKYHNFHYMISATKG